jgi:hypothetical protein
VTGTSRFIRAAQFSAPQLEDLVVSLKKRGAELMTVKQSLKAFLVEILCFAMVFPSLSYASPHAAQPDWGAAAYVHHDALEQVAKKLNRDGFLIENVQASVLGQFRTQADINYFWLQSKRYVRPVAAHVEAQGDTLVVTGQGMPTVTFSEINSA